MMVDRHWSDDIINRLQVRDAFEKKESKYFKAFSQLSYLSGNGDKRGRADKSSSEAGSPTEQFSVDHVEMGELAKLRNDKERLIEKLNDSELRIKRVEANLSKNNKTIRQLEKSNRSLTQKVDSLGLEVVEKNKYIEILNEENISNQIQTNVLGKRASELEKENERLVERWMEKVKLDAEKLNEVNAFLENHKRDEK